MEGRPAVGKPAVDRPAVDRPAVDRPAEGTPAAVGGSQAGEEPAGGSPSALVAAGDKVPALGQRLASRRDSLENDKTIITDYKSTEMSDTRCTDNMAPYRSMR